MIVLLLLCSIKITLLRILLLHTQTYTHTHLHRLIKKKDRYENNTPFGDSIGFNLTVDPTPLSLIAGSRRVNYDFLDFVDEDKDMVGSRFTMTYSGQSNVRVTVVASFSVVLLHDTSKPRPHR